MVPIDLLQLQNVPVRLTVSSRQLRGQEAPVRLHGRVSSGERGSLSVLLTDPLSLRMRALRVTVEVLHQTGLIRFEAELLRNAADAHLVALSLPEPGQMQWIQRRVHLRVNVDLPCWLIPDLYAPLDEARSGTIRNMSLGGVALQTRAPLGQGDRLYLTMPPGHDLPSSPIPVEVCRLTPLEQGDHLAGLRFTDLREDQRRRLEQFLAAAAEAAPR